MLEKYLQVQQCAGVSIRINGNNSFEIDVCAVIKEKQRLHFNQKIAGLISISELKKRLPAKSIIALNLSGKGILHKSDKAMEEITPSGFNQLLPNADIGDFYVQNFVSGERSFVSVIRKSDADPIIEQLVHAGFVIVALSLGPYPVENMLSQLNSYGDMIMFNGYTIRRNDQKEWLGFDYDDQQKEQSFYPVKVELEELDERLVIAYAAAFQLVLQRRLNSIQAPVQQLTRSFEHVAEQKRYRTYGAVMLMVFFVLLVINFFVFSGLNVENNALSEKIAQTAESSAEMDGINDRIAKEERLLKDLGWAERSNKSVMIDQLAALLPPELVWREVSVNPLDLQQSRLQKTVLFQNRKIRIKGNADRIIPVNEWIARMKTKEWVKNVQLENFTFNTEDNTGQFNVIIDY
jgi:Tfp pilus assembly protein PilN